MLFGKPKRIVKRILIVEDEPLTAFDNETMLDEAGYIVVATHDRVADAVADARPRTGRPDPVRRPADAASAAGIDLARIAKERGIPVLFVDRQCARRGDELALGCLMKPYNDRTLKAALEAVDQHLRGGKVQAAQGADAY